MFIFDSGIGGLSILTTIKKFLPNIHYIYMLDNESFPYGNKTELFIVERSITIINKIRKIYPITIAVIACNTISTIALSILRKKFTFPIIGIFPEIKTAEKKTKNKIIGLIATKATINSCYTQKIICKRSRLNTIKIIGTNKLAVIAEKKIRGIIPEKTELKNIFKPWIKNLKKPDTIILGCTHFILLKEEIKKILYQPSICFFDSREKITSKIKNHFNKNNFHQHIKKNILLYSKKNKELKKLLLFLQDYEFNKIKYINLN